MTTQPELNLIRLHCDGELSEAQAAALEAYLREHPEHRTNVKSQVDAERQLRLHVSRIMADCPGAPADLRQRVTVAIAQLPEIAGRIEPATREDRQAAIRSNFRSPQRANLLAIAATLALITGAVLFGIFGRTIDDVAPMPSADLVADAAMFVDSEHSSSTREAVSLKDAAIINAADAETMLTDWLGTPVRVFDLQEAGYEFVRAGRADMPVPGRSGHLVYRKIVEPGQRAPHFSIFIVQDAGRCQKLCEGVNVGQWCCVSEAGVKCNKKILRGTDGHLVYFIVCCKSDELGNLAQHIQLAAATPQR